MEANREQEEVQGQDMRNNELNNNVENGNLPPAPPTDRLRIFEAQQTVQLVVMPGEDVAGKIFEYMDHHEDQSVYVTQANGFVSTLSISNSGIPGGVMTLEGELEIISLSGISSRRGLDDGIVQHYRRLTIVVRDQISGLVGGPITGPVIAASHVNVIMIVYNQVVNRGENEEPFFDAGSGNATRFDTVENGSTNQAGPSHVG